MFKNGFFTIYILILIVLHISCSTNKINYDGIKYCNELGEMISKAKYGKKIEKRTHFGIENNETKEYKLINRLQQGKTLIKDQLVEAFKTEYDLILDENKLIVLLYYPDNKEVLNYDLFRRNFMKKKYKDLEKKLKKIGSNEVLYIHNSKIKFEQNEVVNWIPDPNGIVENTFFIYDQFGNSFVVISPNGEFISYYGEYANEEIWEACEQLTKT